MEKEKIEKTNNNDLIKCPHCTCCFCNETDLKIHLKTYGSSKNEHYEEFRKVHARLEHGSVSGPE